MVVTEPWERARYYKLVSRFDAGFSAMPRVATLLADMSCAANWSVEPGAIVMIHSPPSWRRCFDAVVWDGVRSPAIAALAEFHRELVRDEEDAEIRVKATGAAYMWKSGNNVAGHLLANLDSLGDAIALYHAARQLDYQLARDCIVVHLAALAAHQSARELASAHHASWLRENRDVPIERVEAAFAAHCAGHADVPLSRSDSSPPTTSGTSPSTATP